jgi:hypothetical protein
MVKYILNYYDTKQHEKENETTRKIIMDTKKHENEKTRNNTKVFRVFSCGLKTFVLFSVN